VQNGSKDIFVVAYSAISHGATEMLVLVLAWQAPEGCGGNGVPTLAKPANDSASALRFAPPLSTGAAARRRSCSGSRARMETGV
jgi:hypothetical protein